MNGPLKIIQPIEQIIANYSVGSKSVIFHAWCLVSHLFLFGVLNSIILRIIQLYIFFVPHLTVPVKDMTGTRAKNAMLSQKENVDRNFGASSSQEEEEKVVHCVTNDLESSTNVEGRGIRENGLKFHDSISKCFHSSEILEDSLQDLHIDTAEEIQDNKSEEETDRKELPKTVVTKPVSIFHKTNFCSTSYLIRSTEEENKNTKKFNTESVMIIKDEEEPKEFLKKEFKKSEQYGNGKSHNDMKITYANNYVESYSDSSAFHEAVRKGNVKSVMMLITNGTVQNLDEPDWNVTGDPPLLVAATNHCLPVLR